MKTTPSYSITNDTVMVVIDNKTTIARKGQPNFVALRDAALAEDWVAVRANLTVKRSLADWATGEFRINGESISYKGTSLPETIRKRIVEMAAKGESPA